MFPVEAEQAVEQTVELQMTWAAMALRWRHFNVKLDLIMAVCRQGSPTKPWLSLMLTQIYDAICLHQEPLWLIWINN